MYHNSSDFYLSPVAEKKIEILLDYLEIEWSKKAKDEFFAKLLKMFMQVAQFPKSCVESVKMPNLFKCR